MTNWTLDADSRVTALATTSPRAGHCNPGPTAIPTPGDPLSQNDLSFGTMGEAYQYDTMHRLGAFQRGQVTSGSNTVAAPSCSQAWTLTAAGDWSQWLSTVGATTTTDTRTQATASTPSLSREAYSRPRFPTTPIGTK